MLTSNEPALYREGLHGIRHENLVLCREAGTSEFGEWLDFETMTLCHIDTAAVLPDLLDHQEKAWLNSYNERVYREISPCLPEDVAHWLREKTRPI
jgi:Xaa-Pro aminopeptidase